ncbi:S-locus lectin protein kinase family protein [Actinidia rufa]|uniref:Receptor-like serine/threonine-protein kinase n=1 Tax=Actinidia rufa TaxID=165716 RepID=A0A7J0EZA1_9ERIC|nr:S-locus lectin protein kinase family protein [Actinidia rufa]
MFITAIDTITPSQPITDLQSITSSNKAFRLGFFSPENTTNRYVGIWYNNIPGRTVVWVANRNRPLVDSSGTITISEDGNLLVLNGQKEIVWSSNVSNSGANSSAQLLDSGNLVLEDNSGRTIWESFQNPTDSFLQRMKLGVDVGAMTSLKSWKTPSDPSIGSFEAGLRLLTIPEMYVWSGNRPRWRSGPWNAQKEWIEDREEWVVSWSSADTECDVYGKCGQFGSCNSKDSPVCSCLRGFEPKHVEEWKAGNFTGGCVRRTPLQCERNGSSGQENKKDGFLKLTTMKVPELAEWSVVEEDECENQCLNNCMCSAYAYYSGIGCMLWNGSLIDIQKFSSDGADLYIRVADKSRNLNAIIAISVIVGLIMIAVCTYISWMWMVKRRGMNKKNWFNIEKLALSPKNSSEITFELPLFNFASLAIATNNFHMANKLGQGGFGPVYKGILADGQEIAVKRLSRSSGQGLEQFMNEVVVISKLQHRNLVRLLGCCVEGEEKLLVYEYMLNKSLDAFLFGRGLLYLHRDSRLRIIHRDLKASNILLDQELNPKISDFGMARIFAGNEDQANTRRVVGTYGYMAPEYAMQGRFSEKSDVFSFGVLLLEIISGRRNTSFYSDKRSLSLLGHAWKLWNEGNILTLIDPRISCEDFQTEILKWIHVGLLCVQEFATDRPTVYAVFSMLTSETANLAKPKQPAFTQRPDFIGGTVFSTKR